MRSPAKTSGSEVGIVGLGMTMMDWAEHLDRILIMSGEQLLQGSVRTVRRTF